MSATPPLQPLYLLAIVQYPIDGDRPPVSRTVLISHDLSAFLERINQGGEWTIWRKDTADAMAVMIARFAVAPPITFLGAGSARCLEDRWRRGQRGVFHEHHLTERVTLAQLERHIADFADAQAGG